MTEDISSAHTNRTLSATNHIVGLLPQLAGVVAGISALGIFAGWREMSAYYSELGAPWVLGMLSPSRFMACSFGLMGTIYLFTFLSVWWLSAKSATENSLRRASIVALGLATLCYFAGIAPVHWLEKATVYIFAILAAQLSAISVGLTIGELIAGLAERELKWNGYFVWLLYWIVLVGLLQAPYRLGTAQAEIDGALDSTKLPIISATIAAPDRTWRLVTTIDSSFLAVALGPRRDDHVFRVFAASEIKGIKSGHTK
ncbi:MAG: hypothetical protein HZC22_10105 [Rhodocyclales bacterium]|nr:hypothetical protein [Rhodocyclales bacterium]